MSQNLYVVVHHYLLGCQEPKCWFVYTKEEIQSDEMETYLVNHKYHEDLLDVHQLEQKIWTLDQIINIKPITGWTPRFFLNGNGFRFEKYIDLFRLFGTPRQPYQNLHAHDLNKKRVQLERIFQSLKYQDRELIVFRSQRHGLNNWDTLGVYSTGLYHVKKDIMRCQINGDCNIRKEHEQERIKERQMEGGPYPKPPEWDKVKKRLEELLKNTKPGSGFLYDPITDKSYNMTSKEERKKLYKDVTGTNNT